MKDQVKPCLICKTNNCLFRNSNDTLQSRITLYPKNNTGKDIDNTYYYMTTNQGENHNNLNRNFELEFTFLYQYKIRIFNQSNDIVELKFHRTKSIEEFVISLEKCLNHYFKFKGLPNKCMPCIYF